MVHTTVLQMIHIIDGKCVYLRNDVPRIGSVAGSHSKVATRALRVAEAGEDYLLDRLLRGAGQDASGAVIFGYELDLASSRVPVLDLCRVVFRDEHANVISPYCLDEDSFRLANLLLKYNQQVVLRFQEWPWNMVSEGKYNKFKSANSL